MKKNKFVAKIFPDSGFKSRLLSYQAIYILALILIGFYAILRINPLSFDSYSYIAAADRLIQFQPDMMRTPVYPAVLAFCKLIFAESFWIYTVIGLQVITFLISIYYLQKLSYNVIGSKKVAWIITFLFVAFLPIYRYELKILTESFSISGVIFLTYFLTKGARGIISISSIIKSWMWATILLFLRPSFLFLIPILCLYWGYKIFSSHNKKKIAIISISGAITCIGLLIGYQKLMTHNFGIHSITSVSIDNNYVLLRNAGVFRPEYAQSKELKEILSQEQVDIWNEISKIQKYNVSIIEIEEAEQKAIKNNQKMIFYNILTRTLFFAFQDKFSLGTDRSLDYIDRVFDIEIRDIFLFYVISFILIIYIQLKQHKLDSSILLCWCVCAGMLATAIVGAQSEYPRLILPSIPIAIILLGFLLKFVKFQIPSKPSLVEIKLDNPDNT